tara:strand:+ start:1423 stop:2187 length:765 start_codon:yes stop_codon:yes gene_type:complete
MTSLHVESLGTGPDIALIHGWGLHSGIWDSVLALLGSSFRVHLVDLPGFGYSREMPDSYRLDVLSDLLWAQLPERCHLMGWSLGGLVALQMALDKPERIQRLITVASSPCFVEREDWRSAMNAAVLKQFANQLGTDYRTTLKRFIAIQTMGSASARKDLKALQGKLFARGEPHPDALTQGLKLLEQVDLRSRLSQLELPWLRIYGRLDALVPVASAYELDEAGYGQSSIFAKASHAPFLSHPEVFVQQVEEFLQ